MIRVFRSFLIFDAITSFRHILTHTRTKLQNDQ